MAGVKKFRKCGVLKLDPLDRQVPRLAIVVAELQLTVVVLLLAVAVFPPGAGAAPVSPLVETFCMP